jgi:hypothetical protein
MSLIPGIRTTLTKVAEQFAYGVVECRLLTSSPDTKPRTYSAWATLANARIVERKEMQVQDEMGVWFREETCQLRVPSSTTTHLTVRDQVREGDTSGVAVGNLVWSVREAVEAASEVLSVYALYRRTPMMQNARQGGGV